MITTSVREPSISDPKTLRKLAAATTLLSEQPFLRSRIRCISIELVDDCLILHGTLPSYFLKQVAQESLRATGLRIDNRILIS